MTNKQYSETFNVTDKDCISEIDSTLPNLLGTYILVKWMEIVSAKNINRQLDKQYISVGQKISIEHTDMVKLGEKVQIISTIQDEGKRNILFKIDAISNGKLIASASHHRMIIPTKIISRLFNRDKNHK